MPRRKTPTAAAAATNGGVYLDDDEQLVEEVTTTKKIGRQRRTPPASDEPIIGEVVIDADELDDDDELQPAFGESSLAAMLFGDDGEPIAEQYCTVAVRRNPDQMKDRFASPCSSQAHLPRIANVSITADRADIEDQVRSEYGGGHYFFQIQYKGRLGASWNSTLLDAPGGPRIIAEAATEQPSTQPPPPSVDPIDNWIADLRRQKEMSDLLFGDKEANMKAEIDRLKLEIATRPIPEPTEPPSERLVILEKALSSTGDVQERLLKSVFPDDEGTHWAVDLAKLAFDNRDVIGGVLSSLIGGVAPPATNAPGGIENLLRAPAPPTAHPSPSTFRRREIAPDQPAIVEPKPEPIVEPTIDDAPAIEVKRDPIVEIVEPNAIDAEEVVETKTDDAKPKSRGKAK